MGKIQVLSFEVANLIAAGEVVDRPASAIKEMIENSIDAGARHITVEIQNGGVSFMRVSDDGCGMSPDDLPMAVRRHATSKIRSAEDLDGILTLGFRGEALAAISSVSDMRIISKQADAEMGAELTIEGGVVLGVTERGCQNGTTVIVENLFSIVPARRKFLKRDATEAMAVSANVERVALSHPEIAFRLIVDGNMKLETAGDGNLKNTIYSVFGKDFAARLIPVEGEYEGIRISGFIGRSDNVKANRNFQNFFINHRYVKSRTAQAAIEQAFVSYLPPEKYPCCVIEISLNPERVDVNVHPAKLEVKFSNEKPVFEAIYYTVRQALEHNTTRPEIGESAFTPTTAAQKMTGMSQGSVKVSEMTAPIDTKEESLKKRQLSWGGETIPKASEQKPPQIRITAEDYVKQYLGIREEKPAEPKKAEAPAASEALHVSDSIHTPPPPEMPVGYGERAQDLPPVEEETQDVVERVIPAYRVAGEVFNTYVLVEMGEKMLIIDKHAAHERLIFERLKANLKKGQVDTQLLMIPVEVVLMSAEVALIKEYSRELEDIGFSFTCMKNTVEVSGIPSGIESGSVQDMFAAFVKNISEGVGNARLTRDIIFEKALYQASCKAAIKGGREYPTEQIGHLVDQLMQIPDITVCPHGRPVAMEMKKRTLDRQFERC
ncbi:MAG: DNA mismatch repair endonuclease MutL [Clostridia bacterium]|nr:DNA mismatch repair endonuclease MutL [Clostridia bacterium]